MGLYAGYGFVACVLLVLIAREMRRLLMRGEAWDTSRMAIVMIVVLCVFPVSL